MIDQDKDNVSRLASKMKQSAIDNHLHPKFYDGLLRLSKNILKKQLFSICSGMDSL